MSLFYLQIFRRIFLAMGKKRKKGNNNVADDMYVCPMLAALINNNVDDFGKTREPKRQRSATPETAKPSEVVNSKPFRPFEPRDRGRYRELLKKVCKNCMER